MSESEEEAKPARPKRRKALLLIGCVLAAMILAVTALLFIRSRQATPASIPREVISRFDFPLYFPRPVPDEFKFTEKSFAANPDNSVLTYNFTYYDKPIAVSVQPMTGISTDEFKATEEFVTPIGRAYIADIQEFRTTAAVTTDKSFILINAPGQIPRDAMKEFVGSLRQAR
jgi:hypothetical protein